MKIQKKPGFTLLEIIITVIIVGIIGSLAISNYGVVVEKMRAKEGDQILYAVFAAAKRYMTENDGTAPGNVSQLDLDFRPSQYFGAPTRVGGPGMRFQIIRNGSYTLTIFSTGVITCEGGPAGLCTRMGYDLTGGGPASPAG